MIKLKNDPQTQPSYATPTVEPMTRRVSQSQELANSHAENKGQPNPAHGQSDHHETTLHYNNQSSFEPVGIYRDENASKYGQQIRAQNAMKQDGKNLTSRRAKLQKSHESSGHKSNSSLHKLALKKVHSRYISQSLAQAVNIVDQKQEKGQVIKETEGKHQRSKRKVGHKTAVSHGKYTNRNEMILAPGSAKRNKAPDPCTLTPSALSMENDQDKKVQNQMNNGNSSFMDKAKHLDNRVTTSFTYRGNESLTTRQKLQHQVKRSSAFNSRLSETRNVSDFAPLSQPHRGSLPTDKMPVGYTPLTNKVETVLLSKEFNLNRRQSGQQDQAQTLNYANTGTVASVFGAEIDDGYHQEEENMARTIANPGNNFSTIITDGLQQSTIQQDRPLKENRHRLSISERDTNQIGFKEPRKPASSFASRREVQGRQAIHVTENQYTNKDAKKFNPYTMDRALRTAQIGSRVQPNGLKQYQQVINLGGKNSNQKQQSVDQNHTRNLTDAQVSQFQAHSQQQPSQIANYRQNGQITQTYQQFASTMNGQTSQVNESSQKPSDQEGVYVDQKAANYSFFYGNQNLLVPLHQQTVESKQKYLQTLKQGLGSNKNKESKEAIMRMISQLEFGDKSETFRSAAKQFYVQNVLNQQGDPTTKRTLKMSTVSGPHPKKHQKEEQKPAMNHVLSLLDQKRSSNMGHKKTQEGHQTIATPPVKKGRQLISNATASDAQVIQLQKQLWQQFQLLRILKQNRPTDSKQACLRGDSTSKGPGSLALEYGFELTEEEMYQRLFGNADASQTDHNSKRNHSQVEKSKQKPKNTPYASFDCPECIQMATLMLEEELKSYMNRTGFKRGSMQKGRSGNKQHQQSKSQNKGLVGLQTNGKSIMGQLGGQTASNGQQSLECINGFNVHQVPQKSNTTLNQRHKRSNTQQGPMSAKRVHAIMPGADQAMFGTIYVNRVSPQIFFKKQVNANFKQIIKGEQVNPSLNEIAYKNLIKQSQTCTCGAFSAIQQVNFANTLPSFQTLLYKGAKNCSCAQFQIQNEDPFSMTNGKGKHESSLHQTIPYQRGQRSVTPGKGNRLDEKRLKQEKDAQNATIDAVNQIAMVPSNVLDGTSKYKKIFKSANIHRPNVPFHKHLDNSAINQTIQKVNEIVLTLFKSKIKSSDQNLIKLFKFFAIPIPRGNGVAVDANVLKQPDFLHIVNQKLLQKLYQVLNKENRNIKPESSSSIFRFYVGKGNNYPSVRQIVSRRSWWNRVTQNKEKFYGQNNMYHYNDGDVSISQTSDEACQLTKQQFKFSSGCHFIWTQWRKTEHHHFLKRVAKERDKSQHRDMQDTKPHDKENPAYLQSLPILIYNRLDDNYHLSNKKALFRNISNYYNSLGLDPFEVAIPLTFNVKNPSNSDPEYAQFLSAFKKFEQKNDLNIWIIKPGENSNRGTGIQVANSVNEVRSIVHSMASSAGGRTSIVQKYIDRPLLIHGRKFDIRGYAMMTSINGVLKGYMYRDCYFRTSSKQFDLTNLHSKYIHLTNDAIQMNSEDYGKFESGNKLSINDFQRYLDQNHGQRNVHFMRDLFPQLERLVTDSFRSVGSKIDPNRVQNCFEIFGYDFMIDENFKVYLIEANTNPCLEICSPLLARIIPELLDNSFRIALDPLYQPIQFMTNLKQEIEQLHPQTKDAREQEIKADLSTALTQPTGMTLTAGVLEMDRERSQTASPKKHTGQRKKEDAKEKEEPQKRMRLELLTQIKYTLVYDEQVDQAGIDKHLLDYELKLKQQNLTELNNAKTKQVVDAISGEVIDVAARTPKVTTGDDLFREVQEEEKLDEQAAKKEEIQAAEDEDKGLTPKIRPLMSIRESDDDDDGADEEDGTDDDF